MTRNAFDKSRDERIANDVGTDRSLMCAADGCPNRWSFGPTRTCSPHAAAERDTWPQITAEQQDAETDRAWRAGQPAPEALPLMLDDKREILRRLRNVFAKPTDPRAWQKKLEDRAARGEHLSEAQKHCLREARNAHRLLDEVRVDSSVASAADITSALVATGDIAPPDDLDDQQWASLVEEHWASLLEEAAS